MQELQETWTPQQTEFIEWLALPKKERKPKTVELFAKRLNVDPATLWRWKKLDGFQNAVNELARNSVQIRLPEVYGALLREAEKGSFQHIKLTLELSGDYVERSEQKIVGSLELTADERALATKELDVWQEQKKSDDATSNG